MINDEDSVTQKLLTTENKMDKAAFENEKDGSEGDLRLHDAVCDPDNIEEIETLVSEEPQLVSETDQDLRTPLHTVSLTGEK
jgi:hypothetical protein